MVTGKTPLHHLFDEEGEVFLGEVADQELQGEGGYSLNANIMF